MYSNIQVICSLTPDTTSEIASLESLILSKTNGANDGVVNEVAAITLTSPHVDGSNSIGASISGNISANASSYIRFSWACPLQCPGLAAVGTYECQAFGMDAKGHPKLLKVTTKVEERQGQRSEPEGDVLPVIDAEASDLRHRTRS